jgi:hypothetical protein
MYGQPGFFRLAFKQFWLLFGSIWLLVGSIFLVVGAGLVWKEYRFNNEGVRAEAEVVEKFRRTGDKGKTNYGLQYRFTARDGVDYEGSDTLDFREWDRAREGDRIAIVYLPDDPESNRFAASSEWVLPLVFGGIGLVFAPIGGGLVVWSLAKVRRNLRLMREGVRVDATVVDVHATNVRINHVTQWAIRYAFTDMVGQRQESESDYMSPHEAERWKPGDTGVVRYDQLNSRLSVWLGREDSL